MARMLWEEFWWNNITGAHSVVSLVVDALLESKMVVLKVPSDLPWRHSMRSAIHTAFQERTDTGDVVIEPIDIGDDNPQGLDPGQLLLQKYASSSVSRGYREKSKYSIQEYISQKCVINNRIIWVKGLGEVDARKWIEFCKGFTPKNASEGLFVLEVHGMITPKENKHMQYIDFSKCVSSYDVQLFNGFVLKGDEDIDYGSDIWDKYISATVATVCDTDAEVAEWLLKEVDFKCESALDGISRIADLPEFSRRGAEAGSGHVLWLYRNNKTEELNHRIWVSQVQVLFPIIEMERIEFIRKYWNKIDQALLDNCIMQYGGRITDPMELELGTLSYMMGARRDDYLYILYVPDEVDRDRVRFLHECRNLIAHASICEPSQVRKLLDRE